MNRLILVCLMAQAASQTCLAGTVEKFGTTHIYGTIDRQGIPIFTDIPSLEDIPPSNIEAPLPPGRRRSRSASGKEASPHPAAANISLPHIDGLRPGRLTNATLPSLRDGGTPPEDH